MHNKFEDRAIKNSIGVQSNYLEGMAIVFNSVSEPLMMEVNGQNVLFREQILPEALSGVNLNEVLCCADHDEKLFLGVSPKTLELRTTPEGLFYKCLLPESQKQMITERVERGEYEGNSFRFMIAEDGEKWEKMPDGTYLRSVTKIKYIRHVGPVLFPAYKQTDLELVQRSLTNYITISVNVIAESEEEDEPNEDAKKTEVFRSLGYANQIAFNARMLELKSISLSN